MDFYSRSHGLISIIFSKVHKKFQMIVFESNFILNMLGCMNSMWAFIYINMVGFQIIYIFI
jgi:hypothetical protein